MKALWFNGKRLELREIKPPVPRKGEALVRVMFAGVCNTDLEIIKGYMKFTGVPGHEFVGIVEQGPDNWIGETVTGEINLSCGKCPYCRTGLANHCPNRTVLGIQGKNGAFAEFITLPLKNIHRVPANVFDLDAVFVEPLAAALRILDQVQIEKGDKVFVLGDGKLGQLIARVVALKTNNLLLIGRHPEKLKLAARLGIKTALISRIREVRPEHKPKIVIEATGNPKGFEQALKLCRPGGILVLKSTFRELPRVNLSRIVVDEITVVGSRCGDFSKAISLLKDRGINLEGLISGIYPLDEFHAAVQKSASRNSLKVVIKCLQ